MPKVFIVTIPLVMLLSALSGALWKQIVPEQPASMILTVITCGLISTGHWLMVRNCE